jgi:hypothetical protein
MNKVACVALLVAVSLQAQNAQAPRETTPPTRESASQNQPAPTERVVIERELPVGEEIRKLLDLGYDFSLRQPTQKVFSTPCAIPLMPVPVPDKGNFAIRNTPANPSIDPKIVYAAPLPACAPSVAPQVVKPVELETDKKADKK